MVRGKWQVSVTQMYSYGKMLDEGTGATISWPNSTSKKLNQARDTASFLQQKMSMVVPHGKPVILQSHSLDFWAEVFPIALHNLLTQ